MRAGLSAATLWCMLLLSPAAAAQREGAYVVRQDTTVIASERYTFDDISGLSSRFANALEAENIRFGDRVAIMLDPSLEFYVSLFRRTVVAGCLPR